MNEKAQTGEQVTLTDEVNRLARVLMSEWERVEGKPVSISYVATFADMARAVLADLGAWKQVEWSSRIACSQKSYFERDAGVKRAERDGSALVTRTVVTFKDRVTGWTEASDE